MKKFLPIFIVAGLFFSCQREEADAPFATDTDISVLPSTETKTSDNGLLGWVALTGQTHISAEEAQETALATAIQMREVEGIVTKAPLKIGSIEVVKGDTRKPYVPTKGNAKPEQADVYIVNFTNNQGYVITSADRRIPSVLAYNSYGHLGDTISNPGQAILFSYMQAYIEEQRATFEANKEKLATEAEEAIFKQLSKERQAELIKEGYFDENGKRIMSKGTPDLLRTCAYVGPRRISTGLDEKQDEDDHRGVLLKTESTGLKTNVVKAPLIKTLWEQSRDYNDKVPVKCTKNEEAPVGCVAVAVGQMLAYYKKPAVFKGRTMHWNDMTKVDAGAMFSSIDNYSVGSNPTAVEDIQHLLAYLGDGDLLNMDYGCGSSGSNIVKAIETFIELGYIVAQQSDYNNDLVVQQIVNNNPVYIRGKSKKKEHRLLGINFYNTYDGGHAWLLDGYVYQNERITYYIECPIWRGLEKTTKVVVQTDSKSIELIHNNFGWGGSTYGYSGSTGWYHAGIFDTKERHSSSNTYKSGSEGNYQYDIKTMYIK